MAGAAQPTQAHSATGTAAQPQAPGRSAQAYFLAFPARRADRAGREWTAKKSTKLKRVLSGRRSCAVMYVVMAAGVGPDTICYQFSVFWRIFGAVRGYNLTHGAKPLTPRHEQRRRSLIIAQAIMAAVKWEPQCLTFPVAISKVSVQQLRASNGGTDAYSFKVKTTNPKRYSVRPNVGIVYPGQEARVTVQLPAMKELPSDMNKCKDKFQVLTLKLDTNTAEELQRLGSGSEEQRKALTALWAADAAKEAVVDKIKCAFSFDASSREFPIPEEEPNIEPYSPEPVAHMGSAATPAARPASEAPQTPYVEAEPASEEGAHDGAAASAPSTPLRGSSEGAAVAGGIAEAPLREQLSAATAEASRQRALAAETKESCAMLEKELEKQRKLTQALEARASKAAAGAPSKTDANTPLPDASKAAGGLGTMTVVLIALAAFAAGLGMGGGRTSPAALKAPAAAKGVPHSYSPPGGAEKMRRSPDEL